MAPGPGGPAGGGGGDRADPAQCAGDAAGRAALVTPDRGLAGRVAAELARFGIIADDSAGETLAETPQAVFLRLLAEAVAEGLRPVPLLALLKHPLASAGLAPAGCRAAARALERHGLRGAAPKPGIEGLLRAAESEPDRAFVQRIGTCLAPLLDLAGDALVTPDALLAGLVAAAEALAARPDSPGASRLWGGEEGQRWRPIWVS